MTAIACPAPPATPVPADYPTATRHPRDLEVVTRDGTTLSVHDSSPAAPIHTVLFLHGLCLSRATWTSQLVRIRDDYGPSVRVIAYDHRGHGQSGSAPISTYTIDQLADDLADVLVALDVRAPLTLVTHSMGAMTALAYLSRPAPCRPVDPSGLVLVAAAAGKLSQRGFGRLLATPATTVLTRAAAHAPEALLRALVAPLCATLSPVRGRLTAGTIASITLTALSTTAASTAVGYLPSLRTFDLSQTLAAVRARTVVVSGGADTLTPAAHARELVAAIPDAIHLHVPQAGHMLPQQAPELIRRAIQTVSGLAPAEPMPAQHCPSAPQICPLPSAATRPQHRDHLTTVG
ncbi:alpha/beta hydrolase (plasmid) [Mycobacterium sp. Aquia_216]|uniref:alpha/beta fold hydrolase n=1 Tax=Mycobacterium sp. Aquia_216 TaxID=2991729 RepID=UPI00227A4627|nr:alpha/beta hydrolase [Mycobacterium sp. Aquia_216]WAJ48033.1 alpha/beta hydrolase [Mycobacterium sp. Aquia_216]